MSRDTDKAGPERGPRDRARGDSTPVRPEEPAPRGGAPTGARHRDAAAEPGHAAAELGHAAELLELGDALLELDRDWRIVRVNAQHEELSGRPRAELLGRVIWEVWGERAGPAAQHERELRRCMTERVALDFEEREGAPGRWLGISARPTSRGGIVVFCHDLGALKRAEAQYRTLFEQSADGIYLHDLDGAILDVSAVAVAQSGYTKEELLERSVFDLLPPPMDAADIMRQWHSWPPGQRVTLDIRHRRKDGSQFPVELHTGRVLFGGRECMLAIVRDVTERQRAAAELAHQRELLQSMFDNIPVLLVLWDPAIQRFTLNRAAEEVLGWSTAEANEIDFMGQVYPDPESRAAVAAYMKALTPGFREWRCRTRDGRLVPIEWANLRLTDETMVGIGVDVRRRKEAEQALRESEEKLRSAFAHAVIGFALTTPTGRVVDANPAYCAITGYELDELRAMELPELVHHDERAANRSRIERLLAGELTDFTSENRYLPKNAVPVWVRKTLSLVRDAEGAPRWIIVLVEDITERRRTEERLRRAKEQLEEVDRRKNHFLAILSHELRNPLAPIKNSLFILDRAAPGGEQARRAQAVIDRQLGHLTRLIDDLLDLTRISSGKIHLQRTWLDLNELVQRTAEDHRSLFSRREVRLEVEAAPRAVWVRGDPTRLAQVIGNLLHNAVKFTPRGGHTTIAVEAPAARDRAVVRITDSGSGIPPELLPRLFESFTQADATLDRSQGGLGLGLALVRGIVELHGGAVDAASAGLGRGATFTVTLPLDAPAALESPARDPARRAPPRRVLIIEDSADSATSLREVLELDGHRVAVAACGPSGLARAREFHPDAVLCDIGLPGMDGYAVARAMRADHALRHIALVALTGYAQAEDVAQAREAGFDAHLAKPPDLEALARVLEEVCGRDAPAA